MRAFFIKRRNNTCRKKTTLVYHSSVKLINPRFNSPILDNTPFSDMPRTKSPFGFTHPFIQYYEDPTGFRVKSEQTVTRPRYQCSWTRNLGSPIIQSRLNRPEILLIFRLIPKYKPKTQLSHIS